jgi:NAD(P)-dependent dehydrogenase (short-subunit alcohol dehydrogenase family)
MDERRVVVITGSSGGLGPSVVSAFAAAHARIVALATQADKLVALSEKVSIPPEDWLPLAEDLTEHAAADRAVRAAVEHFGRIDSVVALAGGWRGGSAVADTAPDMLNEMLNTNLLTAFNICRACLPILTQRGWGRIVTISARAALAGQAKSGAYAASKAALVALTQTIAAETRGTGVTANALMLGTIDTPANRQAMPKADFGRWVSPQQVADAILFLCSDQAAAITGALIPLSGRE